MRQSEGPLRNELGTVVLNGRYITFKFRQRRRNRSSTFSLPPHPIGKPLCTQLASRFFFFFSKSAHGVINRKRTEMGRVHFGLLGSVPERG